jgi:hypothetical protein
MAASPSLFDIVNPIASCEPAEKQEENRKITGTKTGEQQEPYLLIG